MSFKLDAVAVQPVEAAGGEVSAGPAPRPVPMRVEPHIRHRMIAEAAYYLAEKRDFIGGDPTQDWLEAEVIIDQFLLGTGRPRMALKLLARLDAIGATGVAN